MADPITNEWRRTIRRRAVVAAMCFAVWAAAIETRLVYLQVFQHADLRARAERQQNHVIEVNAKRGEIRDRNGRVLAYSVDADTIYAVPQDIADAKATARALCGALDSCTVKERKDLEVRLAKNNDFVYVARFVSPTAAARVAALDVEGIGFLKEPRRFYPNRELGAQVLGYVGVDNHGLGGIEAAYNKYVAGQPGKILVQTDARHRAFSSVTVPTVPGATLELTIDEYLQHIVERELAAGVTANRAAGGTAVLMDPSTGEILAMASYPTFNPQNFGQATAEQRKNRAVTDLYEPGSTFKLVTASAALEEGVIKSSDLVDTNPGYITFKSRRIDDTHTYGVLSFAEAIVKSSNVGAIKVGLRLGRDRLGDYVNRFGFGHTTSSDFPGESPGIVWNPKRLDDSALASVSMGYQVGVTPLQMVTATAAVANGGRLLKPHVVRAVVRDGVRTVTEVKEVRRVISARTAAELTTIMEDVVSRGTGKGWAQVEGFTVAGKTGTAQKLVNGAFSHSDYNVSFTGFVPSRKPRFALVVVVDTPRNGYYFGGSVAGPIFQRIADAALRHVGVAPTVVPAPPVLVERHHQLPALSSARPATVITVDDAGGRTMPDLVGLGAR
ncbi:MAG: penicillin-binding protein 2, partial [Acidobacteria bacterium]|nr:penicillin-binding protein 2 [Acidobacteriota bacterium]